MMVWTLSRSTISVVRSRIDSTRPTLPPTSTHSPSRNGRSISSVMPAMKFDRVSCAAKPTAMPTTPSAVIAASTFTPNWSITITKPTAATDTASTFLSS